MDVSIIIVSYNVCDLICKCIQSIYDKVKDLTYEVIVVDNASSDDTVCSIRKNYPTVKLIDSPENLGFGRANNLGAGVATGKYLFFLNPDTELINDAVSILYAFMERHLNVAMCGANLYTPDLQSNVSYKMNLPQFMDAIAYVGNISLRRNKDVFNHSSEPKSVVFVAGADMFIRHTVFEKIGRFDERFFMYFEEAIFSRKIMNLQLELYSVPTARIIHYEGASSKKKSSMIYLYFDSFLKYYKEYYPFGFKMIAFLYKMKISMAILMFYLLGNQNKKSIGIR